MFYNSYYIEEKDDAFWSFAKKMIHDIQIIDFTVIKNVLL